MPTTPFLFALKQQIPTKAFPWLVAALTHDPLVWEALHGKVGSRALETLGSEPTAWHPGALANLALETASAAGTAENASNENPPLPPTSLAEAARLALTLTAFRRENGSWEGLVHFLEGEPSAWRTPLACAFAWADDAAAFLEALALLPDGVSIALDVLLSQPLPPSVQAERLADFLRRRAPDQQVIATWELHHRRPSLARLVVSQLGNTPLPQPYNAWQQAAQHMLAGENSKAQATLAEAWETLRHLEGMLAIHQAQLADQQGDLPTAVTAWEQAASHLPSRPEVLARQALALHRARRVEEARTLLPEAPHHPALQAAAARLYQTSHPDTARRHALDALAHTTELPDDLLQSLAETLLALGETMAAARAALRLAARRPDDLAALDLAADTALQAQTPVEAAEMALLAHQLKPTPQRRRRLAKAQEAAGLFTEALNHRRRLAARADAGLEDYLALAKVALRTGHLEEAHRAAETALAQAPHHPMALTVIGEIRASEGQTEEARRYLEQAIAQHPDEASPYLALADIVAQTEGEAAALEVLQSAAHALPQDAEIHFRLGQHLLALNRPGHARAALETAHRLAPQRIDIAHILAKAHLVLGEPAAARDLLRGFHQQHPLPKTARLLAQAHLAANEPQAAAALLAPLSQQPEATPEDLYHYATALLAAQTDPDRAARALQQALDRLPQDSTSLALDLLHTDILTALAQAHHMQGQLEDALEAYRQALRRLPEGRLRRHQAIAEGLAKTALELHRPEITLAAIDEALQHNPSVALQQLQAEAYQQLNFGEQAIKAGEEALRMAHHAPETALWYAHLLLKLDETARAAEVLESVAALHPLHPDIALLLAKTRHMLGQSEQAIAALKPFLAEQPVSPSWCVEAGEQLLALKRPKEATKCLQRAVHSEGAPLHWHLLLTKALQAQGNFEEAQRVALEALQKSNPEDKGIEEARAGLHLAIVRGYLAENKVQQAAHALEQGLEEHAAFFPFLKAATRLWRIIGDLRQALQTAEAALELHGEDTALRLEAVSLARALLQPESEQRLLESDLPPTLPAEHIAEWQAARAEAALEQGAEVAAAEALATGLEYAPTSARLLALQARLTARRVDFAEGRHLLETALSHAPAATDEFPPPTPHLAAWSSIADAAAELGAWEIAYAFAERVAAACPHSPAASLRFARLHTLQAEAYHRCHAAEAVKRIPSPEVLGKEAQNAWQEALETTARRLDLPATAEGYQSNPALQRWFARGMAAFQGRIGALLLRTPSAADDLAAGLDALRRRKMSLRGALPAFQEDALVRFQYALLLEAVPGSDLSQALENANGARTQRPQWAAAHCVAARLAARLGDFSTAAEAIAAALRLAPDEPRWHALAAVIHNNLHHEAQATHHLQEAVRLEPEHLSHHLTLAQIHMTRGKLESARRTLENALHHHPTQPRLHLLLAHVLFQLGLWPEAAHHADAAIEGKDTADEATMLRIQIDLAQQAPQAALERAQAWLQDHPHDPEATYYAARALLALGQPPQALQLVEETLPHAPDDLELNILRAELHREIHGPQVAVEIWRSLLAARPDTPALWLGLAEALAANNQREAARVAARKALHNLKRLSPEKRIRLHLLMGNLAKEEGQLDQALHHLSEAVRLAPTNTEALFKLAQVQSDRGQFADALQTLETARHLAPQETRFYYLAGIVYKAMRDYENAEIMFRKAAQLDPTDFRIRRQLAAVSVVNLIPS